MSRKVQVMIGLLVGYWQDVSWLLRIFSTQDMHNLRKDPEHFLEWDFFSVALFGGHFITMIIRRKLSIFGNGRKAISTIN